MKLKTGGKKGQVSFEYIILFSFALIIFIVIGSVIASGIGRTNSAESEAQMLADSIKVHAITASLSQSNHESVLFLPKNIVGKDYTVEIYGDGDNMVVVNVEGKQLGRAFLPVLDEAPSRTITPEDSLKFSKIQNVLSIVEVNS